MNKNNKEQENKKTVKNTEIKTTTKPLKKNSKENKNVVAEKKSNITKSTSAKTVKKSTQAKKNNNTSKAKSKNSVEKKATSTVKNKKDQESKQIEETVLLKNTKIMKKKSTSDEEKKKRKWLIILLLLLLLFFLFILDVDDLLLGKPLRPKLSKVDDNWHQQMVVKIEKDSITRKKMSHYLYCIRQDKNVNKCNWQRTDTKSVLVSQNGINYVWIKGVTEDGKVGKPSKPLEVKIDNEAAEDIKISKKVTETTIKIKVTANDKESKVEKYYYKIEDKEYIESKDNTYTFNDLEPGKTYRITVKVVDELGNEKEITFLVTTKKLKEQDENNPNNTIDDGKDNSDKKIEDNNNNNDNTNNTNNDNNDNSNNIGDGNNTSNENNSDLEEIPSISLSGVPKQFQVGDDYKLPTSYQFGKSGGTVKCTVNGKEYKNTKDLLLGTQTIRCSAISNKGIEVKVEKEVEVIPLTTEEAIWDGWIRMNLYYPPNSTDWQWRLGNEEEVRTGENDTLWQDYLGPITIRLTDAENVYIRYKLPNKEEEIITPNGKLLVDIQPSEYKLKSGKTTDVSIKYDTDADKKQFRINDGEWQDYTGKFTVSNDTQIEARVVKTTKTYDEDGNLESSIKQTNYDSVYISILKEDSGSAGEDGSGSAGDGSTGDGSTGGGSAGGSTGSTSTVIKGPNYVETPSYVISGPTINVTPDTLTENVTVTLTTKKTARVIYYKIGSGGSYQRYKEPFMINKNTTIYAYYIENENGKNSKVSSKYIDNIKQENKPFISINLSTTKKYQSSVAVSLSASDYDVLEYSLDGEVYQPYVSSFMVTQNCTVYARAKNQYGTTYEQREITNIGNSIPVPKENNLTIGIFTKPDSSSVTGLVDKVTVEIEYDKRAEKKYYKIGDGSYYEYTGPFEINKNTTITAYATASNASGKSTKAIDFLTSGITQPIISLNTMKPATSVKVTIDYDKSASVKEYRIGTGPLKTYIGPFELNENEMIYAYSKNELGDESESYYQVNNIVTSPKYVLLDQGSYFILRLNYPTVSDPNLREYKWTPNGEWKTYDSKGILLIKKEYKDHVLQGDTTGGIAVRDESGKEIVFTNHYYIVDQPLNELMENLFMRWGYQGLISPIINLSTQEPTTLLYATIEYDNNSATKQYKISNPNGNTTDWMNYDGKIKVNKNNTIIYARSISSEGEIGPISSQRITNIDEEDPDVIAKADFETPTRSLTIQIIGSDNLKVHCVGWSKGKKDLEYFENVAALQENYSTFTVTENGIYTLYVEDKVGNTKLKQIEVHNIDRTAPDIDIKVLTQTYGTEADVEIDYGNSSQQQYKIGVNGTYQTYIGQFTIKSNDVLSLANEDGTLTVYAKGIDEAGNIQEVKEIIYVLDISPPKAPVINSSSGYPYMTEYGVNYSNLSTITYDNRDNISNYYSIDNGKTWKKYTGPFSIDSGTVIAKSVKNESGLTVTTQKVISFPSGAIKPSAFDGDVLNGYVLTDENTKNATQYLYLDESMEGKTIEIHGYHLCYTYRYIKFYDENNEVLSEYSYTPSCNGSNYNVTSYVVPKGAKKLSVGANCTGNGGMTLYEVKLLFKNDINVSQNYPTVTSSGILPAYNNISINYYNTSVQKLYKINDGEWLNYKNSSIRLELGDILYAKGIDKYGKETETNQYTSTTISGGVNKLAYDNNNSSGYTLTNLNTKRATHYLSIDPSIWEGTLSIYAKHACKTYRYITFYNSNSEVLANYSYSPSCNKSDYQTTTYVIPRNSTTVGIGGSYSGNGGVTLYEVWAKPSTTNNEEEVPEKDKEETTSFVPSPTINVSDSDKYTAEKTVEISYPTGGYINEYSFDAINWKKYTGKFTINEETIIYARSLSDDEVISSSSHQVTKIDNVKPSISLDGVPLEINIGDDYSLPSDYSFNNNKTSGTIQCILDDTIGITSTKDLTAGPHNIKCSAKTGSGLIENAEINIIVVEPTIDPPEEETEEESKEEPTTDNTIQEDIKENEEDNKEENKTDIE